MVVARKALSEDFEIIYPLFLGLNNPYLSKEDWKRLFSSPWEDGEGYVGYVLMDNVDAVGFLGLIFSRRTIRKEEHKFCNITSWVVKPEYRSENHYLLMPLVRLIDYTFTNFTPSIEVAKILKLLRFEELNSKLRVFAPSPGIKSFAGGFGLISDSSVLKKELDPQNLAIYREHVQFVDGHFLLKTDHGNCYLILHKAFRKRLPFLFVHYISAPEVFLQFVEPVIFRLCLKMKACGLILDDKYLNGYTSYFSMTLPHVRLFRSKMLQSVDIDTLYSECPLLNL